MMAWRAPLGADTFVAWGGSGVRSTSRELEVGAGSVPWLVGGMPFDGATRGAHLWQPRGAVRRTQGGPLEFFGRAVEAHPAQFPAAPTLAVAAGHWQPAPSPERFEHCVHDAVNRIREAAGPSDLRKVVLARSTVAVTSGRASAADTTRALAAAYPNATIFALSLPDGGVMCGATPELIAHVRDNVLHTQAVAGTGAPQLLMQSAKDRHEHDLVVTGIVASLADAGVVATAAAAPEVVQSGDFAHLVTPITAPLTPGMGVLEVVAALHPTAALCGTPREQALDWIRRHEAIDRGFYGGPVGWADADGNGTFAVALRCAKFEADGHTVRCYGGAGIVADSDPSLEREETAAKMRVAQHCVRTEAVQ